MLPLSHDEVVHGKALLLAKCPDRWQKFANLRLLFGYMYTHPGKKLLFMGGEFGQWQEEWNHDNSLDWHVLRYPNHANLQKWAEDLNRTYRVEKALSEMDYEPGGFTWISANDFENSTYSFLRWGKVPGEVILTVFNFIPVPPVRIPARHSISQANGKEF